MKMPVWQQNALVVAAAIVTYSALVVWFLESTTPETSKKNPSSRLQERKRAADARVNKDPVPIIYKIKENEIVVVEVPVKSSLGYVDLHRCFVWRDREYRTATLSCAPSPSVDMGN